MTIDAALTTILEADADVAAIVGTRIYPVRMPQNVIYPALVYTQITEQRHYSHSGSTGLSRPRYQIDAWADTSTAARSLARAVRSALEGIITTAEGISLRGGFVDSEQDMYDDEAKKYRVRTDYFLWHRAA